jgi:hypothetical protein
MISLLLFCRGCSGGNKCVEIIFEAGNLTTYERLHGNTCRLALQWFSSSVN